MKCTVKDSSMQNKPFSPEHTYISLEPNGHARPVAGGDAFWTLPKPEMEYFGRCWLISEYEFNDDWKTWEMHPHADEYVYLLSGEIELHLDMIDGITVVNMDAGRAIVVPKGIWHTAKIKKPCRMLHVTLGAGTGIRPV